MLQVIEAGLIGAAQECVSGLGIHCRTMAAAAAEELTIISRPRLIFLCFLLESAVAGAGARTLPRVSLYGGGAAPLVHGPVFCALPRYMYVSAMLLEDVCSSVTFLPGR